MRDDGTIQVVYNGHPLYYYKEDTAPNDIKGQGLNINGGLWYVVDPSGNPLTSLAAAGGPDTGAGGGY